MSTSSEIDIRLLAPADLALMEAMLTLFGEAFDEAETYDNNRPGVLQARHSNCFNLPFPWLTAPCGCGDAVWRSAGIS